MYKKQVRVIELEWTGPFTLEDILKEPKKNLNEKGIYAIYGAHVVNGHNSLLYIGQTIDQNFALRFSSHQPWINDENSDMIIYLGIIGGNDSETEFENDLKNEIDLAERLLIYYCAPAYNSQNIRDIGIDEKDSDVLLLNFGKKGMLPYELSSLWYWSKYWGKMSGKNENWKKYDLHKII
jgi:hypothetical protein